MTLTTHQPLSGIRVLDLTHVWSGPSATRIIAALGADVVKVEGRARRDFLRGTGHADARSRYPDQEHGRDPWNRNAWFNTVNTDKQGIVLDLKDPEGIEIAYRLVERCHLVVANFRPGVLDRMGLGYESLTAQRPDISLVEMTGYGSSGPMAGLQAYGAQFDAMSGSAFLTGDGERPLLTGFALSDPVAGLAAASAALSAVSHWRRTGQGTNIEVIQRDAMVPLHGEYLIAASRGECVADGYNRDAQAPVQGIYGSREHGWLALSVQNQEQWEALLQLVDRATRTRLGSQRSLSAVEADLDRVEAILNEWVARRTAATSLSWLAGRLQQAGVAAAPVNDCGALYEDAGLRESGFFRELSHLSVGTHRYPGLPLTIDGVRPGLQTAAPTMDADTDTVLSEWLGLDPETRSDLRARGVIGLPYRPAAENTRAELANLR